MATVFTLYYDQDDLIQRENAIFTYYCAQLERKKFSFLRIFFVWV